MKRFRILLLLFMFSPYKAWGIAYEYTGDVIGQVSYYRVVPGNTLYSVARTFGLGIVEVMAANPGVDPWLPRAGAKLVLPAMYILPEKREGIVINLAELRLYYFPDKKKVMTFPIGIGREGWVTPMGTTSIVLKRLNPTWYPPASIRAEDPELPRLVLPGDDNPLGKHALNLGFAGYAIHGTNKPFGVGLRSSHGCIRMYPEDIEILFNHVKKGTPVTIIDHNYKLGWKDKVLYLEASPTQQQSDSIMEYEQPEPVNMPDVYGMISEITGTENGIHWSAAAMAVSSHNGVPVPVFARP